MRNTALIATAALSIALIGGCSKKTQTNDKGVDQPGTSTASGMYQESSYDPNRYPNRSAMNQRGRQPQPPQKLGPERAGAHILIAYKGSAARKPGLTRTKAEALAFAKKLAADLKKNPGKFDEMAKKHSDGPTGRRGGLLGVWPKGRMVPEFDKAIDTMKVNDISDPVETRFGFHIIKRLETKYAGRHILIAYKGSARAKPEITRTKEQAKAEAKKLCIEAKKAPSKFAELAKKHSNGPSGPRGGSWASGSRAAWCQPSRPPWRACPSTASPRSPWRPPSASTSSSAKIPRR